MSMWRSHMLFHLKPRIVRAEGMNSFVLTVQATKPKAAAKPKTTKPKAKTAAKPKKVRLVIRVSADLQAIGHYCCPTCSNSDRQQAPVCSALPKCCESQCWKSMILGPDIRYGIASVCTLPLNTYHR